MKDNLLPPFIRRLYDLSAKKNNIHGNYLMEKISGEITNHAASATDEIIIIEKQQLHKKSSLKIKLSGDGAANLQTAQWLAAQQEKELYRIDLRKLVSKYIGETEKNLDRIFAVAENKNYVLFFDEADALFGKRTGIRDAHDKYANTDTNYLLQRIQEYKGTVLINCDSHDCKEWKAKGLAVLGAGI